MGDLKVSINLKLAESRGCMSSSLPPVFLCGQLRAGNRGEGPQRSSLSLAPWHNVRKMNLIRLCGGTEECSVSQLRSHNNP